MRTLCDIFVWCCAKRFALFNKFSIISYRAELKDKTRANLIRGGRFGERNIGDCAGDGRNGRGGGGGAVHHGYFFFQADRRTRMRGAGTGMRWLPWPRVKPHRQDDLLPNKIRDTSIKLSDK